MLSDQSLWLCVALWLGRGLYITSKFGDNQPWKAELKILKADVQDFRRLMKTPAFQYFSCFDEKSGIDIPFAINAKELHKSANTSMVVETHHTLVKHCHHCV